MRNYFILLIILLPITLIGQRKVWQNKALDYIAAAEQFNVKRQFDSASICFNNAAEILESEHKWDETLINYKKASWASFYSNDFKGALNLIKKAYPIGQRVNLDEDKSLIYEIVDLFYCYGRIELNLNNFDNSIYYYLKGLEMLSSINQKDSICEENLAKFNHSIGYAYFEKGDFEKAIDYAEISLDLRRKLFGLADIQTSYSYLNLGTYYSRLTDYEKAIEYYQVALEVQLNIKGSARTIGTIYNNLGVAYFEKGDFNESLKWFLKSEVLLKDFVGEGSGQYILSLNNIGNILRINKEYEQSLKNHNQALELSIQLYGRNDENVAWSYKCKGKVYTSIGDYNLAIENYENALEINKSIFSSIHPQVALCYNELGKIYIQKGDYLMACKFFHQAIISNIPSFKNEDIYTNPDLEKGNESIIVFSKPELNVSLEKKALAFYLMYKDLSHSIEDLEAAVRTYKRTVQVLDLIRDDYKSLESKMILTSVKKQSFDNALNAGSLLSDLLNEKCFLAHDFIEKSKSATLYSLLHDLKAKRFSNISNDLLQKEKQLKIDIDLYNNFIQRSIYVDIDTSLLEDWKGKYIDLTYQYDTLMKFFENHFPEYHKLKFNRSIAGISDIQNSLDEKEVLINYYLSNENLYINAISKDDYTVKKISVDSSFTELISDYYKNIKKGENQEFIKNSKKLYTYLIYPVNEFIEEKNELIIIPDDNLFYLPFETLINDNCKESISSRLGQEDYLINKYSVSYNYSATIWFENRKKRSDDINKKLQNNFIGFAPIFESELDTNAELRSVSSKYLIDRTKLKTLKYSKEELEEIVNLFKENNIDAIGYFNENANETNLKTKIKDYKYVHISTHGISNDENPGLSCLAFSHNEDDSIDDGLLYAGEMYNLDLNCELMVLSACKTGVGKLIKGEGLISITRGFIYSGSPNIIYSLWNVPDMHTKELMVEFYKNLLSGLSISNSLRNAKLSLLNSDKYISPYFWSAFVLVSN